MSDSFIVNFLHELHNIHSNSVKRLLIMIRSSFIAMVLVCTICSFCGKDFVSLGRHSWHCKQRVNQVGQSGSERMTTREAPVVNSPAVVISKCTVIKCCCGKICKGNRGLKMHQRSCRVIQGLNNELCADPEEQITDNNTDTAVDKELNTISNRVNIEEIPVLKKGINLPKRDSEWSKAKSILNLPFF